MKNYILKNIKKNIKKQYPNYTSDKIDEIMYGVEGLYLTISKTIIIFTISIILGIGKNLLFLLIAFNIIRLFAFGMHASNSYICLLFSSVLFIGGAYLTKYINIPTTFVLIIYFFAIIIMILYAPSDTVKRPLINVKKRKRFKFLSILVTVIYFIISIISKNNIITNYLIIGMLIECILILPITYKLFHMPYKNYLNYGLNA